MPSMDTLVFEGLTPADIVHLTVGKREKVKVTSSKRNGFVSFKYFVLAFIVTSVLISVVHFAAPIGTGILIATHYTIMFIIHYTLCVLIALLCAYISVLEVFE
ncbi:transmembrane protein, putative, partial [Rhizoctonia solani AG-3 Rhs1AP]